MVYQISFSALALIELNEAIDWYDSRQEGLGKLFIESIDKCFTIISENPEIYSKKISGSREARIEKFPYLVIYKEDKKSGKIMIGHIFHTKRNPKIKSKL